jgi:hypothetical protein
MEILSEIVSVLSNYKLREIDIIDNSDSNSRFTLFYQLIKSGEIKTDKEAEAYFYGKNRESSSDNYYSFKNKFKHRLLNTLYFIDTSISNFNDFQTAYYSAQHEWGAINILYRRGIIKAGDHLSERLLRTCIKYEFIDLCVAVLDKLKTTTAVKTGNKKKYQYYKSQFWKYKEIWDAELIAKEAFEEIRIEYVKHVSNNNEITINAQKTLNQLDSLKIKSESFVFLFYYYAVKEAIYSSQNKWEAVLQVCDEAIAHLKTKHFSVKSYISVYLNQKVIAYLMLNKFEECEKTYQEVLLLQEIGSMNWFKTIEKRVLLSFYIGNYAEAYNSHASVVSMKEIKSLVGSDAEIWRLFGIFLFILIRLDKIPNIDKSDMTKLKINKYLNEIPVFDVDKKGMDINRIIAKIYLMIIDKKYFELIDYQEAFEKYLLRNVPKKEKGRYRSYIFLKMLLIIPNSSFNKITVLRRTENLLKDLSSVSSDFTENTYWIEIIPYELLWSELVSSLEEKSIKYMRKK